MHDTQVIILGGSLVGLSAAAFLSWRGVKVIVVEKHTGSSPHPRAVGFTEHTIEFYRAIGLQDQIPQVGPDFRLRRAKAESLVGPLIEASEWTPGTSKDQDPRQLSPVSAAAIAQDRLEPILRARATDLGADLRLGTEMLSFDQDVAGVTLRRRERDGGREYVLSAQYLISADGAESRVREALGISRRGVGPLMTIHSVLFHCPEADVWLNRGVQQFEIEQNGFRAFLTTYGDARWVLMFYDDETRDAARFRTDIRRALGRDMPFEILATGQWEMAGLIAERYDAGRVFLAGDAAHQLPPTRGGFGANTGIDDVWNLAWKLQMVLACLSKPALLYSYSAERQPIGWLRHQQTFARPDYARYVGDRLTGDTLYGDKAIELGQRLQSAILPAADLPSAAHPDDWHGEPGVRAPHLWLNSGQDRLSTVDFFTRDFTLITENPEWIACAEGAERATGLVLQKVLVGEDVTVVDTMSFAAAFGTGHEGAALVRPDGVIAWRTAEAPDATSESLSVALRSAAALL
jgi:putative polyketide hydroxylase